MKHFFILSLPRCRTAWLANFLTNGDAFCYHEAMRTVNSLDELAAKLSTVAGPQSTVGDADPSLVPILPQLIEAFPDANYVFIQRPAAEVQASYAAAFPKLSVTIEALEAWDLNLHKAMRLLDDAGRKYLNVHFEQLEDRAVCAEIHHFCLGRELEVYRWELLNGLRVTGIAEKAASTIAPWVKAQLLHTAYPETPSVKVWHALMAEMCAGHPDALEWLNQLWGVALTWDHLVDGDPLNLPLAELSFEAVLLRWPLNQFWTRHGLLLAPVLSNAIAGWRDGGRQRHYDCYTETAKAVAFVLGGQALVAKFSRRIHETAARLLAENDQKGD